MSGGPSTSTDRRTAAGLVATGAFAAGCLLTQLVSVPGWRRAGTPEAVLEAFRRGGPVTGGLLFPLEAVATGLLVSAAASRARDEHPGAAAPRAAVSMVGTVAMLPLYFGRANAQLMSRDCPPSSAPDRLASWSRWNAVRTALALVATAAAIGSHRAAPLLQHRGRSSRRPS